MFDTLTRTSDFPEGGSEDFVKLDAEDCALKAGTPSFPGGLLLGLILRLARASLHLSRVRPESPTNGTIYTQVREEQWDQWD